MMEAELQAKDILLKSILVGEKFPLVLYTSLCLLFCIISPAGKR